MVIINIIFFILFRLTKNVREYSQNFTNVDFIKKNRRFEGSLDDTIYNQNVQLTIYFPKTSIKGLYFIFDYNCPGYMTSCIISVLGQTFYEKCYKIVIKLETNVEFSLIMKLNYFGMRPYGHTFDLNYLVGYFSVPYIYHFTNSNFTANYNYNDDFRILLNITNFQEDKTYYLYNSFNYLDKRSYKLFESFNKADNFDFSNFDGILYKYQNGVFEFKKKDNKYKYVVLN